MKADLHIHSIYSDGTYSVRELVSLVCEKGLSCVSLTDHDSVDGQESIINEGVKRGLEVIPGIELSAHYKGGEIHILGYFIDHQNPELKNKLSDFKAKRKERIIKILEKLSLVGLKLTLEEIDNVKKADIYGRLHVAHALALKGYTRNADESFRRYLKEGKPAFVKKEDFGAKKAIDLIKNSGGISFIAHCGSSGIKNKDIEQLRKMGLCGVEVFHPNHSKDKEDDLLKFCKLNSMLISGGSDFHGYEKDEIDNLGKKYVNLELFKESKQRLKA